MPQVKRPVPGRPMKQPTEHPLLWFVLFVMAVCLLMVVLIQFFDA